MGIVIVPDGAAQQVDIAAPVFHRDAPAFVVPGNLRLKQVDIFIDSGQDVIIRQNGPDQFRIALQEPVTEDPTVQEIVQHVQHIRADVSDPVQNGPESALPVMKSPVQIIEHIFPAVPVLR